ncbi:MAG: metalloregulator ArsR/SmtB family transcription factor [Pseudomonadota bacterium]
MFKALAHPARRQIMALLKSGPKTSGELAEAFDSAWPTISRHLSVLKEADLITAERDGTSILYRANASVLEEAAAALMGLMNTDNGDDDLKEAAE